VWANSWHPDISLERLRQARKPLSHDNRDPNPELPQYDSHMSPLQQPVQFLLSVPIELWTRESIKSIARTDNCVVPEENIDNEKCDAL
jgi:hypothetical protein